jgi:hypothetical protein
MAGNKNLSILEVTAQALKLFHQGKLLAKDDVVKPFLEMANYVHEAWKAGLSKNDECAYSASLLIFSTLRRMGLRFASDVESVNKLYLAGMKLAKDIWDKLEAMKKNPSTHQSKNFEELIDEMSNLLWKEYQRAHSLIVKEVSKR